MALTFWLVGVSLYTDVEFSIVISIHLSFFIWKVSIGGAASLFFGFSFLSIAELIYFAAIHLYQRLSNRSEQSGWIEIIFRFSTSFFVPLLLDTLNLSTFNYKFYCKQQWIDMFYWFHQYSSWSVGLKFFSRLIL